jgi:transcriptional regulator with XRE-family HTH domain
MNEKTDLQRILERQNLSDIGRQIGVSASTVSRWASGHRYPARRHAHKLVRHFYDHGLTLEGCLLEPTQDD